MNKSQFFFSNNPKQSVSFKKLTAYVLCIVLFSACVSDPEKIKSFDKLTTPDQIVKESKMIRSIKGVIQVQMSTPLIYSYEEPDARTEYPEGIFVEFFNSDKSLKASLSAEYAIDKIDKKEMEARKNIIIIDYRSHDTLYTEKIIWDQSEKKIYSNNLIKCVNERTTTYGDGFEADERMDFIKIKNQRGTIKWVEEEQQQQE